MEKIFCQTDGRGFFIGLTANNWAGAIDTDEPIFDKTTEKAKWDGTGWIIKSIIEWELKEGEILKDGIVEKVEKPSEFHSWNFETKTWEDLRDLSEEKIKRSSELKYLRDSSFETGVYFEETKVIKGRTQDLADATAIFNMFQLGVQSTTWYYSNGISEVVNQVKMLKIYQAIGSFRSSQFTKEAQLKVEIENCLTLEELDSIVW